MQTIVSRRDVAEIAARRKTTRSVGVPAEVADEAPEPLPVPQDWKDRLQNQIPAIIIGAYVAIDGIIRGTGDKAPRDALLWGAFVVLLALTPVYLRKIEKIKKWPQIWLATGAFAVWVFSLGGPFAQLPWYFPSLGAVVLVLYGVVLAIWVPENSGFSLASKK
jgi:hypothetical protein